MDLIEELKNYCAIDNPVGALMLSGEWGCGKTHFIKEKFIKEKEIEDKYVCVCVSLFGIDSLDKLRVEVKKKWLEEASKIDNLNETKISKIAENYKNLFDTVKDCLPENWKKRGEVVASVMDLVNFVPISNKIFEKKVILVFDDLERTNISYTDLLGCINDYCENQNFNTIIVANEEKIKNNSGNELSYNEIKEKIVQRCIGFVPNYDDVVSDTIDSMFCGIEYKGLLKKNKKLLVKILSGDFNDKAFIERYETEKYKFGDSKKKEDYQKEGERVRKLLAQRSHNIRSFKCAIQDFERVYIKLVDSGIQDCSNWLFSFTCLMMANKAGLLPENPENSRYGPIFLYSDVEKLYPELFDHKFIVDGFSEWIIHGKWNDDVISKEILFFLEKEKAATPLDILKTHYLPEIDDEVIYEGFKNLLVEAYAGNLSLDEYINFLYNCCYARIYDLDLPTIDWERVKDGIRMQIKYLLKSDEVDSHSHRMIMDDNKDNFTEDELSAYQIIKEFRDNDIWIYENNQKLYIDLINSNLNAAFRDLGYKRYNKFSLEMEIATITAFKNANNNDKYHFSEWFVRIWGQYCNSPEIDEQATIVSLKKLRADLDSVMQEYKAKSKNIAAGHTQEFIKKLDTIIKAESEHVQVEQ